MRVGWSAIKKPDALKYMQNFSCILIDVRQRYTTVQPLTWGLDKVPQSALSHNALNIPFKMHNPGLVLLIQPLSMKASLNSSTFGLLNSLIAPKLQQNALNSALIILGLEVGGGP